MSTNAIKVVVVEDHIITRQGICRLLADDVRLKVVGEAGDGIEALQVVKTKSPDIVLMDIALPKMNGVETTKKIKQIKPNTAVLALSAYDDDEYVFGLLDAGVAGYLLKSTNNEDLIQAIMSVYTGDSVLSPNLIRKVIDRYKGQRNLLDKTGKNSGRVSNRQKEILRMAAKGLSNKVIAKQLFVSPRTVESDLRTIFNKLGVGSRTEAVIKAVRKGWITIEEVSTD